jgi:selenocysteine-specific elongation factor
VRGLQVHGHAVEDASAGQRTALNLQGVERAAIERGDVVAPAGALLPALLADATLELLADAPRPLKVRDRVRFHVGTQEVMARVLLVDRAELEPGQVSYGRFRLEAPIVALPGDRYVIRSYSPIVTIGGGTLLDIAPLATWQFELSSLAARRGLSGSGEANCPSARLRRSWRAGCREDG